MTTFAPKSSPPSPHGAITPDSLSDTWLLSRCLARAGFSNTLSIGAEPPISHNAPAPRRSPHYTLHLTRPLPISTLINALESFRRRRSTPALLLVSSTWHATPYREIIRLNADALVLSIGRHFRPHERQPAKPQLLALLWKTTLSPHAPHSRPWQSLRALKRSRSPLATIDLSHIHLNTTSNYFIGPRTHHKPIYDFFKRLFDIAFSLFALLVTLPICIPVALFIKLYDRGPIFFIHTREGRNAKPFGCLKFRTMVRDAEAIKRKLREINQVDGPQFKIANDPRITPIGRFIRKTNIDELPQFLNVLRGDMSIVGPRPSPFDENQLCPAWREARLSVTPGITGLWQISRSRDRGPTDFQEWIFFDTQYVDRRNFLLDLRIVLLTLKELFGKGQ
ncbi:MAG TPA: sugar transferase [Phycisphaerae bacterium]|nr:sugar transferase [Phycisphaerae bacterium]